MVKKFGMVTMVLVMVFLCSGFTVLAEELILESDVATTQSDALDDGVEDNLDDEFVSKLVEHVTIADKEFFFAKGTSITIDKRDDGVEGAMITWIEDDQIRKEYVGIHCNVFGGAHHTDQYIENTSITANGGTVGNLFGGGLHKSNIGTTRVVVNDITLANANAGIHGGGASSFIKDTDTPVWYDGDALKSTNYVENANVIVYNVTKAPTANYVLVYGGGEGIGFTNFSSVSVYGGTIDYVIGSGSNGHTAISNVNIYGGDIGTVQSVNRGSMGAANFYIAGGNIQSVYVGAHSDPSEKATGTFETTSFMVEGGSIQSVKLGNNGGVAALKEDVYFNYMDGVLADGVIDSSLTDYPIYRRYGIHVTESDHGYVYTDYAAVADSPVWLEFEPEEGYQVSSIKITDAAGNEIVYDSENKQFIMPASAVTIEVLFAKAIVVPETFDGIGSFIVMGIASLVSLFGIGMYFLKKGFLKNN